MMEQLAWFVGGMAAGVPVALLYCHFRERHVHEWGPWQPANVTLVGRIYPRAADGGPMVVPTEARECACGETQYQGGL